MSDIILTTAAAAKEPFSPPPAAPLFSTQAETHFSDVTEATETLPRLAAALCHHLVVVPVRTSPTPHQFYQQATNRELS